MNIPDTVTTGITVVAVSEVAKQAQDFIAAASGHPGETIGEILGNVAHRRLKNAEIVSNKAHLILLNIGQKVGEMPLNILQPALEAASLQDDSYLQDTWANLLANAADERKKNPVEPSFARILAELSTREVRFLDALFKEMDDVRALYLTDIELVMTFVNAGCAPATYVLPKDLTYIARDDNGAQPPEFRLMMDILERQQIIIPDTTFGTISPGDISQAAGGINEPEPIRIPTEDGYKLTQLGHAFIRACQKPQAN